jgi:formate hydrogenlyase transcriptional activator
MRAELEDPQLYERTALTADMVDQLGRNVLPSALTPAHSYTALRQRHLELIGESAAWLRAVEAAGRVAPTDANVLLLGETGTGKELLARSIHLNSARSQRPFVRLDCTSLSPALCESELYGHVRGAFTGAIAARHGRIREAHEGTLFIDEVGELPLDIQPRLLRFLQERELEPLGSSRTVHVDVRVIAATHRDLLAEVAAGRFRRDLYYRLATFGIHLPALRQRGMDISLLASHFAPREFQRLRKANRGFAASAFDRLHSHTWPGNVRELRHAVERACIVCSSPFLQPDDFDLSGARPSGESPQRKGEDRRWDERSTLRQVERDHICSVLRVCNGVIEGPRGAANVLGLPPSTVRYRIRKLGIVPSERQNVVSPPAYLRAAARNFEGGDPVHDWLQAEAEIAGALQSEGG